MGMNSAAAPTVQQAVQNAVAQQPAQPAQQSAMPALTQIAPPNGTSNPFQTPSQGGKGGPPPSPQQLGQGLQQQATLSNAIQSAVGMQNASNAQPPSGKGGQPPAGQIPMSMQRQPQGGMAGRTPQVGSNRQMRNRWIRR